ncbi:hypothetical protein GW17_00061546, partial [Ensete ventricosum]
YPNPNLTSITTLRQYSSHCTLQEFVAKIQTYSKNLGTGGSPANVSDAFAESTLKTAYGRFSRQPRRFNCPKTWAMAIQPLLTAGSTVKIFEKVIPSTFRITT